jgi:1,2-diacylglycerol 3-beta-galactosyltransferase
MKKTFSINVITGQGGAGHYATYHAIRAIAEQRHLPWQFQITDVDDIITELSGQSQVKNAYDTFGFSAHDLYNWMVKSGWTWLWPFLMRLNKLLVRLNYKTGVRIFEQRLREKQPDLIVSVMPLFNKMIWESVQRTRPDTPIVTVLTDFADCPPHFWFEPKTGNYFVCGTDKAVAQARSLGVSAEQIIQTSGLVIHPNFYPSLNSDRPPMNQLIRHLERQRLRLDPDKMTGLVMFGGNGSSVMLDIAKRMEGLYDNLQLIFICGRNEALANELRQYQGSQKWVITTFTDDIPYYMQLANFFIGKPGNVSISEAIAMQLPVITECNAFTMIQERDCAKWVAEKGVGIVLPNFKAIDRAVAALIQPENYAHYRANLAALNNGAVFEVVGLLQKLLRSPESEAVLSKTTESPV